MNSVQDSVCEILGLKFNPFVPASSTDVYFFTQETREILDELYYGIVSRKGFMLLLGEVGVGKTSLLLQLLKRIGEEESQRIDTAWVFNTSLGPKDFLLAIAQDFGIELLDTSSVSSIINELYHHFLKINREGGNCAIVVDEAHNLPFESLETLRMLSNLEGDGTKLVQIVLAGQPELETKLNLPELRQLKSRIYIFRVLYPFNKKETELYVNYKLSSAGSQIRLSDSARDLLYALTHGNPRMIHLIMDRALHLLALQGDFVINENILRDAALDIAKYNKEVKERLSRLASRKKLVITVGGLFLIGVLIGLSLSLFKGGWRGLLALKDGRAPASHLISSQRSHSAVAIGGTQKGHPPKAQGPVLHNSGGKKGPVQPSNEEKKGRLKSAPSPVDPLTLKCREFLRPFSLISLEGTFKRAILKGDIEIFLQSLPRDISLIGIKRLPRDAQFPFSAFPWKKYTSHPPDYVVLWRPPFHIDKKYPADSPTADKLAVQKMLKEMGYYRGPWDGKFGHRTLDAIKRFQEKMGLPVTHGLDERTLFWLCVEYEHMKRKKV